jgi:hypothetical protein
MLYFSVLSRLASEMLSKCVCGDIRSVSIHLSMSLLSLDSSACLSLRRSRADIPESFNGLIDACRSLVNFEAKSLGGLNNDCAFECLLFGLDSPFTYLLLWISDCVRSFAFGLLDFLKVEMSLFVYS